MTGPNMEATVSRILASLDLTHEWLRVWRRVVYRGRLVQRIFSLFPGYMFIMAQRAWSTIEQVTGVRGFVRFGGIIEQVPDDVVLALRARADRAGAIPEDALPFHPGDRVIVSAFGADLHGRFRGYAPPCSAVVDVR